MVKTANRSEKTEASVEFAYDQIPRSDFVDDREELLQIKLDNHLNATFCPSDLRPVLLKGKLRPYTRIYAYIWRYDCRAVDPDGLESLTLGDTIHNLKDKSQVCVRDLRLWIWIANALCSPA